MTYLEKYEELTKEFNITETCDVVVNEGNDQVVYDITDENNSNIIIDFDLLSRLYTITYTVDGDIWSDEPESF